MKKEVKILGLSYSQSQNGSYVVVLSERKGKRKIPIIVKPNDAQQIALKIEGMKSPRPLTHDLFKELSDSYGIDIQEVYIHTILEGVFYTKLLTSNGMDEVEIETTAGDGIALSLVFGCPIFVDEEVLQLSGVYINDDGSNMTDEEIKSTEPESEPEPKQKKRKVSIEDLERMLDNAIQGEEYEIAAELRDRIQKIKEGKK